MPLSLADFRRIASNHRPVKTVEIPEMGEVCIRQMTGAERERMENSIQKAAKDDESTIRALYAIALVCDQEGKPVFAPSDVELVNSLPWQALAVIRQAGDVYNALRPEDYQELAKN